MGNNIVTKHDRELSERNNGKRIMEFPPGIETGDGGGWDMQLSNAVYNEYVTIYSKIGISQFLKTKYFSMGVFQLFIYSFFLQITQFFN